MASSLWKSFAEAVVPGSDKPAQGEGVTHNHMVGGHPLSCRELQSTLTQGVLQLQLLYTSSYHLTNIVTGFVSTC